MPQGNALWSCFVLAIAKTPNPDGSFQPQAALQPGEGQQRHEATEGRGLAEAAEGAGRAERASQLELTPQLASSLLRG